MFSLFFSRDELPTIRIKNADPFTILSSEKYLNKIIPFSHLYISSNAYLKLIRNSVDYDLQKKIITVSDEQAEKICQHTQFPLRISDFQIDSVAELNSLFKNKSEVNIIVINGIGLGYADNFVGLAILQRMAKLLSPRKVNVHLMQTLNKKIAPIYLENTFDSKLNITVGNNCVDLEKFMVMDAYVDLTEMLDYKEYDEMSLARFYATAFSIENLINQKDLHPKLHVNKTTSQHLKAVICSRFKDNKPIVFLQTESSNSLRNCDSKTRRSFIDALIDEGYNVISTSTSKYNRNGFSDCSDLSTSLDSLKHLIEACDAVISVGTVSYHLAAALGKPTLLLPIVKSDIRTASQLSEVLIWLPKKSKKLYLDKHKHKSENDLQLAQQIWKNTQPHLVAHGLKQWVNSYRKNKPNPSSLAIIVLHYGNKSYLHDCIQSLTNLEVFDPILMDVVDLSRNQSMNAIALNNAIEKAIQDGARYIWVINEEMKAKTGYIEASLNRFKSEPKLAIVAGKQVDDNHQDNALWAGSLGAFPIQSHKQVNANELDFTQASHQNWVPFDSMIIKSSIFSSVGFLDESMHSKFYDVDFCFRVKQHKWSIMYEPLSVVSKQTAHSALKPISQKDVAHDTAAFYKKWSDMTKCIHLRKLENEIIKLF